jgi:hypothetical protein
MTTPMSDAAAVRVGTLFDFPQRDGGVNFTKALRMGIEESVGLEGFDRPVEFVARHVRGLPLGTEHDVVTGVHELDAEGVLCFAGPSVSDNGLIVAPLVDEL